MRGKLFNVRGETQKRILENKEIAEIKQILGIESGKKYTPEMVATKLRYGKVLFMTDQDLDGSHIKGLGINMFDAEWQSLLDIPGFIGFMNTPILKARKGAQELAFYNDGEWDAWCGANDVKGWKVKYYKGLVLQQARSSVFAQRRWSALQRGEEIRAIMVFSENEQTIARRGKRMIANSLDEQSITYQKLIGREMIHFSKYDCDRSI